MRFTYIGFDVREWPWDEAFYAGENGWPRNEEVYIDLRKNFNLTENRYQPLDVHDQENLFKISEVIRLREDCNLIAVEFSHDVVRLLETKYELTAATKTIDLSNFICSGYDVCDVNGFFTVFRSKEFSRNELIPESQLFEALETVQLANVFDRNHFPFVIAKIYSLK